MKPIAPMFLGQKPFQFVAGRSSGSEYKDIIHLHEGIELHYIEQGSGQVVTGSRTVKAESGTLLFFQPFQLHKLAVRPTDLQPFVRSFVVYDPMWLQPYLQPFPRLEWFHRRLWKRTWTSQALTGIGEDHPVARLFRRLALLPPPEKVAGGMDESYMLYLLELLELLRRCQEAEPAGGSEAVRKEGHTELAMEWIDGNYRQPFRLQELADYLHLSPSYVSGLFRKEVGESLTDYLAARRIKEACQLLSAGDLPLERIAEEVGIPNMSYFCQLFKRQTGETPGRFRTRMRPD